MLMVSVKAPPRALSTICTFNAGRFDGVGVGEWVGVGVTARLALGVGDGDAVGVGVGLIGDAVGVGVTEEPTDGVGVGVTGGGETVSCDGLPGLVLPTIPIIR